MTHEYVIALNGAIRPAATGRRGDATAIGWAADTVLAVGSDAEVASISRGDSTFIDLEGCIVTALPDDIDAAIMAASEADSDVGDLLVERGLLADDAVLRPGSAADLAFWRPRRAEGSAEEAGGTGREWLRATVRGGAFSQGDERRGPFPPPQAGIRSGAQRD